MPWVSLTNTNCSLHNGIDVDISAWWVDVGTYNAWLRLSTCIRGAHPKRAEVGGEDWRWVGGVDCHGKKSEVED